MTDKVFVWDFDGVLNANVVEGRFVWTDHLLQDWGIEADVLADHLFASGRMREVIRGQRDLRDVLSEWFAQTGKTIDVDAFLAYWWAKDAHPDAGVIDLIGLLNGRHVIGTNNEARRAHYIETTMGFGDRVDAVFASGRMGCAKPEPAFFNTIEIWSGGAPRDHILIDDTATNVSAAQAQGWLAFHFTDDTRNGVFDFLRGRI